MSLRVICPYLRPEWDQVRERSGLSSRQVARRWINRILCAKLAGFRVEHRGQRLHRSMMAAGVDNPFSAHHAWRLMVRIAVKEQLRRAA